MKKINYLKKEPAPIDKPSEPVEVNYKPKVRVQCLTDEGIVLSDRLVDQAIEFMNGPKEAHNGPVRIEVNLMNKEDVENLTSYVNRLIGNLPIKQVGTKGRPSNPETELSSPREEVLAHIERLIKQDNRNQDEIITQLRGLGFVFMLTEDFLTYFPDFPFKDRDIGEASRTGQYLSSVQWMVRCIKRSKDPKSDKYDPQIIFGFQVMGEREEKFIPYLYKERIKPLRAQIPSKNAISFNNTELTKFPKYMLEEERLKFSTEMRQLMANSDKKPSKFFNRWYEDVIFPTTIKDKMAEIAGR